MAEKRWRNRLWSEKPGQYLVDKDGKCKARLETPIHGGCWVGLDARAPCGEDAYEYKGKCYWPSMPGPKEPIPSALPVASSVDRLFDAYASYLEALVIHPDHEPGATLGFHFPRNVPHLLSRDARLVEFIRSGAFDPLMLDEEDRAWAVQAAGRG